jgi:hypothetical protein
MSFMNSLRHAFAIDSPGPAEPTEQQKTAVDLVCSEIARRHLTTPALIFLETFRPLSFVGSQAMHFFEPIVSAVIRGDTYHPFAEFLERRGSVDYICRELERLEAGHSKQTERKQVGEDSPNR